jgi:phenylpropionate dioxygenase-like ring-hydroxylating dioxygenase large terminal subunit
VNPGESRIRRAKVDRLGPLLFASLSSDPIPFSEVIDPIKDIFVDAQRLRREDSRQYSYGCNWKTGIENSLECYHCPTIHPGFNDLIDLKNYLWELRGFCGITGGQLRVVPRSGAYSAAVAHEDSQTIGRYYYVWPNLQLLRYPGPPNLTIARWLPRGVDRTVCMRDFYFGDEFSATQREEFIQYVEEIQEQDIRICENVQGNVQSNAFQKSILRLTEDGMGEHGIRQFQLLLLEAFRTHLSGLAPSARATVQ